jgi:hypothetical protein
LTKIVTDVVEDALFAVDVSIGYTTTLREMFVDEDIHRSLNRGQQFGAASATLIVQ